MIIKVLVNEASGTLIFKFCFQRNLQIKSLFESLNSRHTLTHTPLILKIKSRSNECSRKLEGQWLSTSIVVHCSHSQLNLLMISIGACVEKMLWFDIHGSVVLLKAWQFGPFRHFSPTRALEFFPIHHFQYPNRIKNI